MARLQQQQLLRLKQTSFMHCPFILVIMPLPVVPGCVISCRPIGVLKMEDEAGEDDKLVAVPTEDVTGLYRDVQSIHDIDHLIRDQIAHFFEHYKDLEKGKWVKVDGWDNAEAAKTEIISSYERAQKK